jgi:cytochrome c oxidase subunit II
MTGTSGRAFAVAAALAAGLPAAAWAAVPSRFNLQPPQTIIAHQIYDLHILIMWIICAIFVVVFGVMAVAIVRHRKSIGHQAAQFHENTTVEVLWTVIPFLILIGMAWPATRTLVAMKDTSAPDITIKVTGYQWKWGYDYLEDGISFYSSLATPREQIDGRDREGRRNNPHYLLEVDNPVVVPVGRKVRVITTANDVIHSWWVPAFGVKQDAIPGFVRDTWFRADRVGTFRGQCAELCGKDHGFMPIVVEVVEEERYVQWVLEQKKRLAALVVDPAKPFTVDELRAHGEKVYAANCVACHMADGTGVPNTFPPLSGSPRVVGPKEDQIQIVLQGVPGTAMPAFKHLTDVDVAAVVTYARNSWANKTGDMATPAEVTALRK